MLEPIYRIEFFLDAIVNNTTPPDPIYRAEFYLAKIAGADVEIPEPVYRMEKYLAYLCGVEVELPDPIYRIEYYLAFLCGLNVELPEPIYRVEFWLWDWCGGGGIEKTVTGNPIHILDALAKPAQALSVKLEPIQDLHGYDNPWPAGGGKNLINQSDIASTSATTTISANVASGETYTLSAICSPESQSARVRISYILNGETVWAFGNQIIAPTSAVSSATVTVPDGATELSLSFQPLNSGRSAYSKIQLEKGATATSYAPYSNICPISGHTDADVTRTGKNLLNLNESSMEALGWDRLFPIQLSAGTFTLSCQNDFGASAEKLGAMIYLTDESKTDYIVRLAVLYQFGDGTHDIQFTLTEEQAEQIKYIRFCMRANGSTSSVFDDAQIMIELGSTASDYQPYVGTTYPIPLGQTVYGGTLDVTTGVLTVTHAVGEYDGSADENWVVYSAGNGYYISVTDMQSLNNGDVISNYLDKYSGVSNLGIRLGFNNNVAYIYQANTLNGVTDLASWKAHLAQTPLQVFYPLATPQTIQLTPTQVELLQGENNIWSDGEMTLVYLADGNASDVEALNILLGGRYTNTHGEDEPTDREALDIVLGGKK